MTEPEWLTCMDPRPMLRSVIARWTTRTKWRSSGANLERLRLFACACCRRIEHLLDEEHRTSVQMIEAYARTPVAGGLRKARQMRWKAGTRVREDSYRTSRDHRDDHLACLRAWARRLASSAVYEAAEKKPTSAVQAHWTAAHAVGCWAEADALATGSKRPSKGSPNWDAFSESEPGVQVALLRDIVGNPFRPPPSLDAGCLRWNDGAIRHLALTIDGEQAFNQLPVLADALEEAGCNNQDVLAHCRQAGVHVRGCWVVDAVLGLQ